MMDESGKWYIVAAVILLLGIIIFFTSTPVGRAVRNMYNGALKKVDDRTLYETKKKVENECRSMISSYEADKAIYEQYRDSDDKEKQSWAEQAKMRANRTAANYNNYILQNSYVYDGNVPKDIRNELEILE